MGLLGITAEEAAEAEAKIKSERDAARISDDRVCSCGHSAGSHSDLARGGVGAALRATGRKSCKPSSATCPCQEFDGVLRTSNLRKFIYKTEGGGARHALARGIAAAEAAGVHVEWTELAYCRGCKAAPEVGLIPVALGQNGEVDVPSALNVLLCAECRKTV